MALRITSLQRAFETRVANPLLKSVLQSRFHWVVSDWLILVSYVGSRSGRRYTFPIAYHQLDGAIVAATPKGESNWWRNFQQPRECRVWLRGTEYTVTGELLTGDERNPLLAEYVENHGLLGRMLGVDTDSTARSDQRVESNPDVAVVRFNLDHH